MLDGNTSKKNYFLLGIRSRMVKKLNKPKSYVTEAQRPNLVKKNFDQLNVLLTDITDIRVKQKWVYLASLYDPKGRRVIAHKVSEYMTKELATSVIEKLKSNNQRLILYIAIWEVSIRVIYLKRH